VIDVFFKSLAEERGLRRSSGKNLPCHSRAGGNPATKSLDIGYFLCERLPKSIGVVLSGGDADGTRGIEAIKAAGGITLAQSEDTAQVSSMPPMAIATGQVDFVQGATFTVKLPLVGSEFKRPLANNPSTVDVDLTGVRVLAVDGNPDALELLAVCLEQHRAEVQASNKASKVLAALATFKPNVLLCDIGMPNTDDHDLIQQIRALAPDQGGQVPAIAVTAYIREADHQKALDSGFQKHMAKPVALESLASAVAELVGKELGE